MSKVNIVGHRRSLDPTLTALHRAKRVQVIDVTDDSGVRLPPLTVDEAHLHAIEDLRYLRTRLDALLRLLPAIETSGTEEPPDVDFDELKAEVDEVGPEIEALLGRLDELRRESETLPRHLESLKRLLPLLPDMAGLEGYETTALLVDRRHSAVLGELNEHLTTELEGNFEMMSDKVDPRTIGAVVIYPRHASSQVHRQLGHEQVSRVRLPGRYETLPFSQALVAMEHRLTELPAIIESAEDEVTDFIRGHPHWAQGRRAVVARLEQLSAIRNLGATPHTFVLSGWVPTEELKDLRLDLEREVGIEVVVHEAEIESGEEPPVLLQNPEAARPFESFVKLLQIPRYGTIDPAVLMLIFLPLFFGMMLGDVVYGVVVVVGAWLLKRRVQAKGFAHDLARFLLLSGAWTVVWGVVYGEYLGDLGRRVLGLEPLWIDREEAIEPLLLFALAVGAFHVTLGLVLGVWQAYQMKDRHKLGERLGMLIALIALFFIAGAAAGMLPEQFMTPAIAAAIVGLVLLIGAGGVMGLLMGPLEVMGTIGNILSYLRIAAIGLASVYLARVANELGATGPLWLGIIVASLFHALNLVLGVFSPTIQALRLHYVEFFGKFYESGGKAFRPFGAENTGSLRPTHQR
ncbi:MAG: V-type ATPase 116kDa subunit family protein [Actinomycetota bacterium]|nr:V-type ATPase 116kDa subunit family protein [Actinomycetota bacterium]